MTFQNLWPLFLLIFIPVIILLYILKQKARDEKFSSSMLWQEIYKNLEARTPFEKLKHNILMYIQILIMLVFIFSLMAPMLKKGGKSKENIVLVMDYSASMSFEYEAGETRLEESISEASALLDKSDEDAVITIITCDGTAQLIYQGANNANAINSLKEIDPQNTAGTLDDAAATVNSIITGMTNVKVICYTDTDFDSEALIQNNDQASVTVHSVYSQGENCSVDYINYDIDAESGAITVLCRVTNHGEQAVSTDVSLYMDTQIADVSEISLEAGESETIFFKEIYAELEDNVILRAELAKADALIGDNTREIVLGANSEKNVLLVSDGNVFLEKALALESNITLYKTDDTEVLSGLEEEYDLYVFDGIDLTDIDFEKLGISAGKSGAAVVFVGCEALPEELGLSAADKSLKDCWITFEESDITEYVEDYTFGISEGFAYTLPEWALPLIATDDGDVVSFYGENNGLMIGVIGFDIHNSDLALQAEFPIFVSELEEAVLNENTQSITVDNFPVDTESEVAAAENISDDSDITWLTGSRALRNYLLAAAFILLIVEWIIYNAMSASRHKKEFLIVRCVLLLLVILAGLGISYSKKSKGSETIFVVDVSDSMSGNTDEIQKYLQKQISEMPKNNKYGIVVFGKESAVEQFLSEEKSYAGFSADVATTATNIEKAIQTGNNMLDTDSSGRLVLITDGAENEGSMTVAAATLKRKDVELLVIDTGDSINANSEVYIDSVDVPDVIHEGDNFNVTVTTVSNVETDGILTLYEGRTVKSRSQVHLTKGTNQFIFNDTGTAGSISWYKAVIEPDEDTIYINNTALTYAQIDTKPRVLLIEGTSGEGNEFEKVLQAANIDYDKVTPRGVPEDISDLTVYKAVIMLNVYSSDLPSGFDDTLSTYVKDFAGGFVCIGGDSSYALGGYRNTAINDILPVNCELQGTEASPTIAMTMVIDHSGSMSDSAMSGENSSLTCLTLAKQAAMAAVSELRTVDEVGVLAFDDTYDWVVPRTNVDDVDSIKNEISSIADGGGTSIYPALYQAYEDMLESDAKIKHIILLTDGQDGYNYYDDFIKKANADGITISTVAVGQGADTETLEYIAEKCGGRYYYTDASNDVPKIFAQEVYLSSDTYLINEEFYPVITAQSEILNGVFDDGEPPLYGYVATTAKQTATVILESSRGDPILATWQYGLGRTVAWCSDGTNEWTGAYADWEQYPLLWSNIISYVISDTDIGEDSLEVNHKGNSAQIVFETDEYDSNTAVTAIITDDDGNENEISLNVTKPGVYEGDITFDTTGMYSINVRKSQGDDVIKSYNTAYANQYSDEYKFCDSVSFEEDVTASGGKVIDFDEDIWDIKDSAITSRKSITVPIIIIAMLLFLFDIVNRRFLLDIPGRLVLLTGKIKRNGKERHIRRQEKKETTIASKAENVKQNKDKKTETKKNEQAQTQAALDVNALLKKKQDRQ